MSLLAFPGTEIEKPKHNPDVVALAEELLRRAKEGEIRTLVFAAALLDGETDCGWSEGPYSAEIMAAVADVFHRFGHMRMLAAYGGEAGIRDGEPA